MKSPDLQIKVIVMSLSIMAWACVSAGDGVPAKKSAKFESSKLGNIFTDNSGRLELKVEPSSQAVGVKLTVSDENGVVLQERNIRSRAFHKGILPAEGECPLCRWNGTHCAMHVRSCGAAAG
jgi:hypothetical protein